MRGACVHFTSEHTLALGCRGSPVVTILAGTDGYLRLMRRTTSSAGSSSRRAPKMISKLGYCCRKKLVEARLQVRLHAADGL